MAALIELKDAGVEYPIYDAGSRSLKNALVRSAGGRITTDHGRINIRALNGISLTLNEGTRLGVVGHNGAGKSTLLKVMSRIYEPSWGEVRIEGKVSSLVDIMMGMDPDSTGYENIYLRGTIMGQTRKEIAERVPEIEAFAGLGQYMSLPIRTYSTGMTVRLAFTISTSVKPDILIMDEMVGAADAAFVEKAYVRVSEQISSSRIVVFASHDHGTLKQFCNRAVLLKSGTIVADGSPDEVIAQYERN